MRDGSLFPPKYVENKLKFYPNIKEAVAFGDGRAFVAAFINIDLVAVGNWRSATASPTPPTRSSRGIRSSTTWWRGTWTR
jgi:long-subunit acyl-CoA synthetase (AMP-forming)